MIDKVDIGQHSQGLTINRKGQIGSGQIKKKVKEDENGIGIADARSLSTEAGEGGVAQIGKILDRKVSAKQSTTGFRHHE